MKEYVIDAKDMDEKELNRTIKQQAAFHEKMVLQDISLEQWSTDQRYTSPEMQDGLPETT